MIRRKDGQMVDIGYARVSTRDQDPQLQLSALERAGCTHIFEEHASGTAAKRPVRDQALLELQHDDTLTVWKLDRLGRSVIDLDEIITDLKQRGVKFRSLTEHIDTSTAQGVLFFRLLAVFAEFERELIRERTLAGLEAARARGQVLGPPLFGFAADHVTVVDEQADLLREAAKRALDGEPLSRIVDDFNARGHRPGKATRWRVTHLRRILLNPRVVAIIGEQDHDALRRLFLAPDRQKLGRPADHLLSGVLRCGYEGCGQPLYAATKTGKTGVPQMVYRCKKGSNSGGRFAGCGRTVISQARADAWAEEAFAAVICSDDFAAALSRRRAELLAGEATAEQLDDWRQERDELEQIAGTRFYTDDMRRRHDELQRLVREATARLLQQPELQALLDLPKSEAELRAAWAGWSIPERRAWLRRVLERIVVKPGAVHHRGSDVEARLDPRWKL